VTRPVPRLLDVIQDRQRRNQTQLRAWVEAGMIPAFDEKDPAVECGKTEYVQSLRFDLEVTLGLR
jgi:hypothetical protein